MVADILETPNGTFREIGSVSSTATADRTPKVIVVKEGLTVYLGGAGMAGGYIDDQVQSLRKVGVSGVVVGHNSEGQYAEAVGGVNRPISEDMLVEIEQNILIKNIVVVDLTAYGDPIHAGMSFFDLAEHAPLLGWQMVDSGSRGEGVGHFYYGIDGASGEARRLELANFLYVEGLR